MIDTYLRNEKEWRNDERLVVFTEYKTTLDFLNRRLKSRYPEEGSIRVLYGAMDQRQRDLIKAAFNNPDDPIRILIATDTASEGLNLQEAIIEAGKRRIRPIIMTSLTTILALLPLTIGFGESAALRSPMALAVIGGLITSTMLTLLVIPCVYSVMDSVAELAFSGQRQMKS